MKSPTEIEGQILLAEARLERIRELKCQARNSGDWELSNLEERFQEGWICALKWLWDK